MLRNEVKNKTDIGRDIENIISKGDFATDEIVNDISKRYIELYENIIGKKFKKRKIENMLNDIESNIKIVL